MADNTQVLLNVPKDIIDAQVQAAVAKVLMEHSPRLIAEIVARAIGEKDPRSYGNQTMMQAVIQDEIRKLANEEFKKWVESQRDAIRKQVAEALAPHGKKMVQAFSERLVSAAMTGFSVNVYLKEGDR